VSALRGSERLLRACPAHTHVEVLPSLQPSQGFSGIKNENKLSVYSTIVKII
jgi:hypothetical protein